MTFFLKLQTFLAYELNVIAVEVGTFQPAVKESPYPQDKGQISTFLF